MFEQVEEGHAEGQETVVFRYNREERLKSAPQIVRDYYDGKLKPVRGFKVLWTNKSNRFILLSLVIFVAFAWIYGAANSTRSNAVIDSTSFDISAFAFQEEIYTSIKVKNKKADENSPPMKVQAEFLFIDVDNQIVEKKEMSLIYRDGEESLTTKMTDYDIIRVDAIITVEDKEKELSTPVKR